MDTILFYSERAIFDATKRGPMLTHTELRNRLWEAGLTPPHPVPDWVKKEGLRSSLRAHNKRMQLRATVELLDMSDFLLTLAIVRDAMLRMQVMMPGKTTPLTKTLKRVAARGNVKKEDRLILLHYWCMAIETGLMPDTIEVKHNV